MPAEGKGKKTPGISNNGVVVVAVVIFVAVVVVVLFDRGTPAVEDDEEVRFLTGGICRDGCCC